MTFARWVYRIAGIYGLVVIGPLYFLEAQIGRDQPPPITHPEYFYGFAGVTLAWQVAFLIIGQDPVRYRWLMIPAMIEKFSFVAAAAVLLAQNRLPAPVIAGASFDCLLGVLFAIAFWRTARG